MCLYVQMQTRSADEPMTTFVLCNECGYRWKVNSSHSLSDKNVNTSLHLFFFFFTYFLNSSSADFIHIFPEHFEASFLQWEGHFFREFMREGLLQIIILKNKQLKNSYDLYMTFVSMCLQCLLFLILKTEN